MTKRQYQHLLYTALIAVLLCSACEKKEPPATTSADVIQGSDHFATHFSIDSIPGYRILTVQNAWNGSAARFRWLLTDSTRHCPDCTVPDSLSGLPRLRVPLRHVAVLSTAQMALMERLGLLDRIVAVGNSDYIYSPALLKRVDSLQLPSVGNGGTLDLEKLLALSPDAVFTFGTGSSQHDDYPRLVQSRLPALLTAEWMESHPLGRLEWIRFMGVLFGREAQADSLFKASALQYDSLCGIAKQVAHKHRPVVLTGYPDGDNWNAGGGQSYVARFLSDAGARYLWEESPEPGFIRIPLEKAMVDGMQAEYWLHPGSWHSRSEILAVEPRVSMLPAWQNNRVYQHSARIGIHGSNDFYESGIAYPERILADMIRSLHPGALSDGAFYYYQHLQ